MSKLATKSIDTAAQQSSGSVVRFPRRRNWSLQQKVEMVSEAKTNGWSHTAYKYNIRASTLHSWKRLVPPAPEPTETFPKTLQEAYTAVLKKLVELDKVENQLVQKFKVELECGSISTYNAMIGFSALKSSTVRIETLRLLVLDRLIPLLEQQKHNDDATTPEQREL